MGIPKFYRWLSERYPLVNQPVGVAAIPEFDNLYLDMNGIIHNCTHGNDPSTKLTEAEMVVRTFNYLDRLVQIAKPQKLLFMAIDGVAPRAKMNQQRARRFRSARDAEEAAAAAARKGEAPPAGQEAFDSNCITPGTAFMARLGDHLRFFIRHKMASDPVWQRPRIVFSGHDVPGEGEHKIMEYIRWAKRDTARPWEPNQRHCLYGLDADLIMLSLVTHEPHFCLLREVVSYSGGSRGRPAREVLENPCAEHFILFQVALLRDYLELEFQQPTQTLGFQFDLERVIDDFVLFCMLIGNDFLPSLPTLDIAEGALDKIFGIYKELLPAMGGYLTEAGQLNRRRLQLLLDRLAQLEQHTLELRAQDADYFEAKKSRGRGGRGGGNGGAGLGFNGASNGRQQPQRAQANELDEDAPDVTDAEIAALGGAASDLAMLAALEGLPSEPEAEGPTMMGRLARELMLSGQGAAGLQQFKEKYYADKLEVKRGDDAARRRVVDAFVEGLHWVLEYYYRGVASWTWFYPFHYAPMCSDMTDIAATDVHFAPGQPFLPFEQLLAVLPAASCRLLPQPFEFLMKDPQSPVLDFYPTDFRVDQEGKRNDWEGIVLVPFVDEQRLLAAAKSVPSSRLTEAERARNKLGEMLVFEYRDGSDETYYCASTLPNQFASVQQPNSRCMRVPPPPPLPDGTLGFVPALFPGTNRGPKSPAGFATLKTLQLSADVRMAGVAVFGRPSGKESLILKVKPLRDAVGGVEIKADMVAGTTLGERCWVRWPYLQEALVSAVSDRSVQITRGDGGQPQTQRHGPAEVDEWAFLNTKLSNESITQQGLEVGPTDVVLHVRPCEGLVRQLDGTMEKRFSKTELRVPLQVTLRHNPAPDPRLAAALAAGSSGSSTDLQPGSRALFVGRAYYGCAVTVLDPATAGFNRKGEKVPGKAGGMLRVSLVPAPMTAAQAAQTARRLLTTVKVQYQPSGAVARKLSIDPRTLGKITGNVEIVIGDEKVDVGLAVKSGRGPLCVPDYTKPAPSGTGWQYSQALTAILTQYKARFAWVFRLLEQYPEERSWEAGWAFPDAPPAEQLRQAQAVRQWLTKSPLGRRPLVKTTAEVAPEEAVRQLQTMMPPAPRARPEELLLENVSPGLLLPPAGRGLVAAAMAGGTFELGDRVACLRGTGSPALGARGTVVGIYDDDAVEVLFDEPFAEGTDLHGRSAGRSGGMLPATELLNLSKPQAVAATGPTTPKLVRKKTPATQAAGDAAAARAAQQISAAAAPEAAAPAPSPTAAQAAAQAALAGAANPRQQQRPTPQQATAAVAAQQNGVPWQQNGSAPAVGSAAAAAASSAALRGAASVAAAERPRRQASADGALAGGGLQRAGSADQSNVGGSGSRPGSAPGSRTASPARVRPLSAMSQPKGPQPKGPTDGQNRGFVLGRGRSLPPPPASAGLSTAGVAPGMALLQSLRQSEAPPAAALAAVVPPPQPAGSIGSAPVLGGTGSGRLAAGSSGPAAGSSGAALLKRLQGMSVSQRPAPAASEVPERPAEKSTTSSAADVQVAPGLAALQELQRAPPPQFADAAAAAVQPDFHAPALSAALETAAAQDLPAGPMPAAVSAAASVGLLRQLRGSSFEVEAGDLNAAQLAGGSPDGASAAAVTAAAAAAAQPQQQSAPATSLPDGLSLLRELQRSREPPAPTAAPPADALPANSLPLPAAAPEQLPLPTSLPAAPAPTVGSAPATAPAAPDLGSSFLQQLRQKDGGIGNAGASPVASPPALQGLSGLTEAASALARRGSAGSAAAGSNPAAASPAEAPQQVQPAQQQAVGKTAAGAGFLQMLQRGGSAGAPAAAAAGGAAGSAMRPSSALQPPVPQQQPQQRPQQQAPQGGRGGRGGPRPYLPQMQLPSGYPPGAMPPPPQGGHWPGMPFPQPGVPPLQQYFPGPQTQGGLHPGLPGHPQQQFLQHGFPQMPGGPQHFPPQPWPGQQFGHPPPPGWHGMPPAAPGYGFPPGSGASPPGSGAFPPGAYPAGSYGMQPPVQGRPPFPQQWQPPPPQQQHRPQQHGQGHPGRHPQQPQPPQLPQPPPMQQQRQPIAQRQGSAKPAGGSGGSPSGSGADGNTSTAGAQLLSLLKPGGAASPAKPPQMGLANDAGSSHAAASGSATSSQGATGVKPAPAAATSSQQQPNRGGGGGLGNAGASLLQQLKVGGATSGALRPPQPSGDTPVSEVDFWRQLQQKGRGQ